LGYEADMIIRHPSRADVEAWAAMRAQLWPDLALEEHRREAVELLSAVDEPVFVAELDAGEIVAFAEASLRHDYVNGCETSPVGFLEGIFVARDHRRAAIARDLVAAVSAWALSKGCRELASDALLDNLDSHAFHGAIGFEETERVVCFRKRL
jgi:aminoglycoside 6'-N-acetyltransferase I